MEPTPVKAFVVTFLRQIVTRGSDNPQLVRGCSIATVPILLSAMQALLTGKKRLPGFSGEWEVKRLGEVATIRDGTHQTPKYVGSGIPFYSVEHVTSASTELN